MKDKRVTIKIPTILYKKIQALIEDSGFSSPTEFIVYVLRDILSEHETENEQQEKSFTPEELRVIKKKLKNLGYL